jgi:hypothetical protein
MAHGFGYLVAIIDWYSRTVLAWVTRRFGCGDSDNGESGSCGS